MRVLGPSPPWELPVGPPVPLVVGCLYPADSSPALIAPHIF